MLHIYHIEVIKYIKLSIYYSAPAEVSCKISSSDVSDKGPAMTVTNQIKTYPVDSILFVYEFQLS